MIEVVDLQKTFRLYHDPKDRLKEIILRRPYSRQFHALKGVSFTVSEGETLGIIGENGAGKSTLLKLLTGVILPTSGRVHVDGKITGLLELGTGFNMEMTGLKNIFMNGLLIGMHKEEVERKLQAIVDFSELGEFVEEPIKTYSSGMLMRLAFSIAIHAEPRAFVVDEALSVGDAYFQQKCMLKIREFREAGGSIIFVSHDLNAVKTLCDKVMLLDKGEAVDCGDAADMVDLYMGMILKRSHQGDLDVLVKRTDGASAEKKFETGTGEVSLLSAKLTNDKGEEANAVVSETDIKLVFRLKSFRDLDEPHYGFHIRNKFGISVFETNSYCMKAAPAPLRKDQSISVVFQLNCNLSPADYSVSFGLGNKGFGRGNFEEYILWKHNLFTFKVIENTNSILYSGYTNLRPRVELHYD
jgi:ABC-type polysaccharide/polyol phosphate transport system ATPase subunit